ncbi:MAG: adenylate/guanylate cyclase domain-containing protein [Geminicoccaceae bacterium]|nr:adenylate/guanylate cyclase domain-containing protein [Geminicoccaceae bacterium]
MVPTADPAAVLRGARRLRAPRAPELAALLLLAALLALRILDPVPLVVLRQQVFDSFQRTAPRIERDFPAVVVDIDEAALAAHGQWPWPRDLLAELVGRVLAARPKALALDILLAEPDRLSWSAIAARLERLAPGLGRELRALPENDAVLARTIAEGPVVLALVPLAEPAPGGAAGPPPPAIPLAELGRPARPYLPAFPALLANLPELEAAAAGRGSIGLPAELDNLVRRVPLLVRAGEVVVPALVLEMLRVAAGESTLLVRTGPAGIEAVAVGGRWIATDKNALKAIRFAARDPRRRLSALDLLADPAAAAPLADRFVILGSSATGLLDVKATPVAAAVPGSEIHAQLLETILAGTDLVRPPGALGLELALALVVGFLVLALVPRLGAFATLVLGALLAAVLAAGSFLLFLEQRLLVDASFPALAGLSVYLVLVFANYAREEAGRKAIRTAFGRYLSAPMVDRLAADPTALRLGGELREATVMFVDVREFTGIAERLPPERLTLLVNRVLTAIADAIQARGGTIDKFIGDAVMAFWNAPLPDPEHARRASLAALDVLASVDRLDRALSAETARGQGPWPRIRVGIGLNSGPCHIGNMGSQQRFAYSALGRPVNVAARLEALTKELGVPILLGAETARGAADLALVELEPVVVRGAREAVDVWALLGDATLARDPDLSALRGRPPLDREALARLLDRLAGAPLVTGWARPEPGA